MPVDILVRNGFILTMQGEGVGLIEDGAVAIEGNRIVAVGKTHSVERETGGADKIFSCRNPVFIP